jgi:hypothetical protein
LFLANELGAVSGNPIGLTIIVVVEANALVLVDECSPVLWLGVFDHGVVRSLDVCS